MQTETKGRVALAVVILITGTLVSGCKTPRMAVEWSKMMREQQIVPVFPPREDVRVGDVYLHLTNPDSEKSKSWKVQKDFLPIPALFARVNFETNISNAYHQLPPYPLTPTGALVTVQTTITSTSISTNAEGAVVTNVTVTTQPGFKTLPPEIEAMDDKIYLSAKPNRLRHVAFPEFSFAKVSKASIQAVIPVEGMSVAVAATRAASTEGYLKISSGESVSLSLAEVYDSIGAELYGATNRSLSANTNKELVSLQAKYSQILELIRQSEALPKESKTNSLYLSFVNEVFYARTIDVAFTRKRSFGGGVNVAGSPATNDVLSATTNAAAQAQKLNELNVEMLSKSTPGGSLTFTSASEFGVGLRRTFARPIAVGIRALTVEVQKKDGKWEIVSAVPSNTWKPTSVENSKSPEK